MRVSFMILLGVILLIVGCSTPTLEEQIDECKKENKRYVVAEKFNFRTGEMEKYIKCK